MKGRFITFEGPEGSGKSTHAKWLVARLRGMGFSVLATREPGGTPVGEGVRRVLQHDAAGEEMTPAAEALLFAACRAQLVRTVILPALREGRWVVCDRFADSTTVYQGYGRGLGRAAMERLNAFAINGAVPDATMLLDIDVKRGFERLGRRNEASGAGHDRFERENVSFHQRVRSGYLDLANRHRRRFIVIDADRDMAKVRADIWQQLRRKLAIGGAAGRGASSGF